MRNTTLLLNFVKVTKRLEEKEWTKEKGYVCIFVLKCSLSISIRGIYGFKIH